MEPHVENGSSNCQIRQLFVNFYQVFLFNLQELSPLVSLGRFRMGRFKLPLLPLHCLFGLFHTQSRWHLLRMYSRNLYLIMKGTYLWTNSSSSSRTCSRSWSWRVTSSWPTTSSVGGWCWCTISTPLSRSSLYLISSVDSISLKIIIVYTYNTNG